MVSAFLFTLLCLPAKPAHAFWGSKKKAEAKAGAVLFRDKGCAHCHGPAGVGGKKGPSLSSLPKDKKWTPAKMTDQILNGGQKMPPFSDSLTDQQVAQIVAYLRTKRKPVPPLSQASKPQPVNGLIGSINAGGPRPLNGHGNIRDAF